MTRKPEDDLTGRAAIEEIDRRLGGLLGPLAEGLAKVVEAAEKAQAQAGEGAVETGRGGLRVRSGLSVRVNGRDVLGGGDAAPGRDPARRAAAPAAAPPGAKTGDQLQKRHFDAAEPHYDLFETATEWSLTADMPGAARQDLTLALENRMLTIETAAAPRRWRLTVEVPAWLAPAALSPELNNGVLSLTASRDGGDAS